MIFSGNTLEFKEFTLIGYPIPSVNYQWYRNNSPIAGATSSKYQLTSDDVFSGITLEVLVSNLFKTSSYFYPLGATVFPNDEELPSFLGTPVRISEIAPYVGLTVGVTSYGSTGSAPITTTFTWISGGETTGTNNDIYEVLEEDQGNTLFCFIGIENIFGSTGATVDFGTVDSLPSFISAPSPVSTPVYIGDTAIVQNYESSGTPPITTTFTWFSGGETVGSNQDSYVAQESDYTNTLECVVKLENNSGSTQASVNFGNVQEDWDYRLDGIYQVSDPFNSSYNDVTEVQQGITLTNVLSSSTIDGEESIRLRFDSDIVGPIYMSIWNGTSWSTYQSWSLTSTEQRFSPLLGGGGEPNANDIFVLYENNPGDPSQWTNYNGSESPDWDTYRDGIYRFPTILNNQPRFVTVLDTPSDLPAVASVFLE